MEYKKYLWNLDLPEEENFLEAHYIYSLIDLAGRRLGRSYYKVLDVPCGVGRHHKHLRGYGLDVYGVDSEEELIKACSEEYGEYSDRYRVMDMRSLSYQDEFDVILNWYTSFGYFTHEENIDVLRRFYTALTKNGILILDYPSYWSPVYRASMHGDKYIEITVLKEVERYRFQYKARLYEVGGGYDELYKVDEVDLTITIYPPDVLKSMLEETGFKILYAFRGRSFTPIPQDKLTLYDVMRTGVSRIVWLTYKPQK